MTSMPFYFISYFIGICYLYRNDTRVESSIAISKAIILKLLGLFVSILGCKECYVMNNISNDYFKSHGSSCRHFKLWNLLEFIQIVGHLF